MGADPTSAAPLGAPGAEGAERSDPAQTPERRVRRPGPRFPSRRWWVELGWRHLLAIAATVFALFPVVWVVSAAVNPTGSISAQQFIPDDPSLVNFRVLVDGSVPFFTWLWNSLWISGSAAVLTVLLCALGAYAFSRMRFAGRRPGLFSLLLVQMFPQLLAITALFVIMTSISSVAPAIGFNTRAGLLLVYLGGALGINTWLIKGFFDTIPKDLDEAARVDGAGHAQIFFTIILPLAAPILAVVGLLAFITTINDFFIASVLLRTESNFTLAVGLQNFISEQYGQRWGVFAAGALVGGFPVILLFYFLQRYLVAGLTSGAVKG